MILIISILSAFLTHYIAVRYKQGAIRSSALLSLAFGFMLLMLNQIIFIDIEKWLQVFFGASFIGMCSESWSNRQILIASLFYTLLYFLIFPILPHSAGGLGLCAFSSVLISSLFRKRNEKTSTQ